MTQLSDSPASTAISAWRSHAAQIVEELFPVTPSEAWDMLLDLRQHLLFGQNWNQTLDFFLSCRERFEADHYLPFYRLRRMLSASLRLESSNTAVKPASLDEVLRGNPRSLAQIKRTVRRELFEHSLELPANVPLQVVEKA